MNSMNANWNEGDVNEEDLSINRRRLREQREQKKQKKRKKQTIIFSLLSVSVCCLILLTILLGSSLFGGDNAEVAQPEADSAKVSDYELGASRKEIFSNEPTPEIIPEIVGNGKGLIVVDPGHGGMDGGTSGFNGENEKDFSLEVSLKLRDNLIEAGYSVFMTREDDTYIGLGARPELANKQENPLIYLSIHMNAVEEGGDISPTGVEVICYEREGSIELADILLDQIVASTGARKRSVLYKPRMAVTRIANMPACLIECGFITNPDELKKLKDEVYQEKLVDGIVSSVEQFLTDYPEWKNPAKVTDVPEPTSFQEEVVNVSEPTS